MDTDPGCWLPDGWQQREIVELVSIESRFRFRRISDTIYEIRPPDDETSKDIPHLSRLLPSNRAWLWSWNPFGAPLRRWSEHHDLS
ncbi:MAG: hypothetical protein H0W34_02550 [Pyrinomonadaceae bacterium]|nr:hypothetical protein [Pyrinomonadaceae bacterium]